jgi:hypothetical protein
MPFATQQPSFAGTAGIQQHSNTAVQKPSSFLSRVKSIKRDQESEKSGVVMLLERHHVMNPLSFVHTVPVIALLLPRHDRPLI